MNILKHEIDKKKVHAKSHHLNILKIKCIQKVSMHFTSEFYI
jgi:hypothetical protein